VLDVQTEVPGPGMRVDSYLKRKVLFLCETNGLYSPMAEALLQRFDPIHFEAFSAGTSVGPLHPLVVEVMKEIGVDLGEKKPTSVQELSDDRFDFIVTLDEGSARAQRSLITMGVSSHRPETLHWKVDNPLTISTEPQKRVSGFRMVRDQIVQRLRLFVIVNAR
jgi:protein-tyrosine-phosphatase